MAVTIIWKDAGTGLAIPGEAQDLGSIAAGADSTSLVMFGHYETDISVVLLTDVGFYIGPYDGLYTGDFSAHKDYYDLLAFGDIHRGSTNNRGFLINQRSYELPEFPVTVDITGESVPAEASFTLEQVFPSSGQVPATGVSIVFSDTDAFAVEKDWTETLSAPGEYKINYDTGEVEVFLNWDGATTYIIGDRVSYLGDMYECTLGHANEEPPNVTYWTVVSTAWDSITAYVVDDVVSHMGVVYKCILDHTDEEPYSTTYWIIVPDDWDGATTYVVDDRVLHSDILYECILGNANEEPPNATYWAVISDIGTVDYTVAGTVSCHSERGSNPDNAIQLLITACDPSAAVVPNANGELPLGAIMKLEVMVSLPSLTRETGVRQISMYITFSYTI